MEIKDNVSECPPSSQVFEKSVRYYSGCGYITDLSTRHQPDRIASDVQAAPRFQIISPRRPSACRRVRYKRRFAQDTCRVGTQNALEGRFPAFAAGRPALHTRAHAHACLKPSLDHIVRLQLSDRAELRQVIHSNRIRIAGTGNPGVETESDEWHFYQIFLVSSPIKEYLCR